MSPRTGQAARSLRKPRARFHHGDLRAAALEVAAEEVEASGADALSVRAVARALRVSDAAIYRHFASREALLGAIGLRGLSALLRAMLEAMSGARDPADRLLAAGRAYLGYSAGHPGWYRLFASRGFQDEAWGPSAPDPELARIIAKEAAAEEREALLERAPPAVRDGAMVEARMKEALAQLVPRSEVDDHYRILWSLAHGFAGLVIERLFRRVDTDEERLAVAERGLAVHVEMLRRLAPADSAPEGGSS